MEKNYESRIKSAVAKYEDLLRGQLERVERINASSGETDYSSLDKLIIGVCGGDGIGPIICKAARDILADLLADEIKSGKIELRDINGSHDRKPYRMRQGYSR